MKLTTHWGDKIVAASDDQKVFICAPEGAMSDAVWTEIFAEHGVSAGYLDWDYAEVEHWAVWTLNR